jgi:hypothetical protein
MKTRTISLMHPAVDPAKLDGRYALVTDGRGHRERHRLEDVGSDRSIRAIDPEGFPWIIGPYVTLIEED